MFLTIQILSVFTVYNLIFLQPHGLSGFTYIILQFVVFYQYCCAGSLMMVATATKTCR